MTPDTSPCKHCGSPVRLIDIDGSDAKPRRCTNPECITNSPNRSLSDAP